MEPCDFYVKYIQNVSGDLNKKCRLKIYQK